MADRDRLKVLTDAQWEVLAPLIEACRPPHKTDHHDLRRTIEAIIWRHDNGAKWRQMIASMVRRRSWWSVLCGGRHAAISGANTSHCASVRTLSLSRSAIPSRGEPYSGTDRP